MKDVDECKMSPPPCRRDQMCENLPGSFTCVCPKGYEEINETCQGIKLVKWIVKVRSRHGHIYA